MKTTTTKATDNRKLYLVEFYVRNPRTGEEGWAINFAWIYAAGRAVAEARLERLQGARFDCVIQTTRQAEIVPLVGKFRVNTPDANLFIYS